jgi:hypothetical protein
MADEACAHALTNVCRAMARASPLTDARLDSLYRSEGFGGERTMRAQVIRELIDEIRALRRDLADIEARADPLER